MTTLAAVDRVAVADDLHLTRIGPLVTVATTRWEPGVFVYDIAYLTVDIRPRGALRRVVMSSRGTHFAFQVLRVDMTNEEYERFASVIERARMDG